MPVPPFATVRALSNRNVLMWAVEEAVRVPKYGEEEALKKWTVPADVIANGPLAEKVCVAPVSPLRDVMALMRVQVPFTW